MKKTIETKFEPGQKVWMLINSKAVEKEIKRVIVTFNSDGMTITYNMVGETEYSSDNYEYYDETRLFQSKDALKEHVFGQVD